jgi:hypothetical protein
VKSVTFFITTRSRLRQTEAPFEKIKAPSEKIEAPFGKIEALFSVTEGHLMILQYPVGKPTIQNAHKDESTIIYSGLSFFLPAPLAPPAPGPGAGGARGAGCFPVSLLYARIHVRPSSETETSNLWPFCVNLPKSVEIFNLFSYLCPAIAYKRKEQYEFSKKMN